MQSPLASSRSTVQAIMLTLLKIKFLFVQYYVLNHTFAWFFQKAPWKPEFLYSLQPISSHLGLLYLPDSGSHFQHIKTCSELVIWHFFLAFVISKRPIEEEESMLYGVYCARPWISTDGNIYSMYLLVDWTVHQQFSQVATHQLLSALKLFAMQLVFNGWDSIYLCVYFIKHSISQIHHQCIYLYCLCIGSFIKLFLMCSLPSACRLFRDCVKILSLWENVC